MDIKKLRRIQLILLNVAIIGAFSFFYLMTTLFTLQMNLFFILIGCWLIGSTLYQYVKKRESTFLFPKALKELALYEKKKMGNEYKRMEKTNATISGLLGLFFIFMAIISPSEPFMEMEGLFFAMILLVMLGGINASQLIHNHKVDKADVGVELKGYNKKMTISGVVIGLGVGYIVIMLTIVIVLLSN